MEKQLQALIDKLESENRLDREEWIRLIRGRTPKLAQYLFEKARKIRQMYYGTDVYIRGLIEFTNYCKNDCYYCGIRRSNAQAHRYRLSQEQILQCCRQGYDLGFRTFVLQGGEDGYFTEERMVRLIREIRKDYPDCAITLSIGERSYDSYLAFFNAGADRYLLRHETWDTAHYQLLHPPALSAEHRRQCLWDLKKIGYQVGTGYMVGSPFQTAENLADDMLFLEKLNPQMVGIGPFIPHHDTPFKDQPAGTLELTLYMLGLIRLLLPKVLLPATTALGTIDEKGRELGILAGANVVMPNLSPENVRKDYLLYDNKICTGSEAAECRNDLENRMHAIGYQVVSHRGDSLNMD
nr:[FeFe] hydrogenase H-cluster radical SAM maturase HydE [uncultured Blautia sp.]